MNPLKKLSELGQSVWLDYIQRSLITSGQLAEMISKDGVQGVTSNPSIFKKAIGDSTEYDGAIAAILAANPRITTVELYETLAIHDIQLAADALRGVFDRTKGADGFVSLEVSPHLASDTQGTIVEGQRLWKAVARPNLMIKVPATAAGLPAITALIADGINVNVTLMFSLAHYEAVANAYIRGIARCKNPESVSSVASFFVSRVDSYTDKALEAIGSPEALSLRGKAAVANSRLTYKRFEELFYGAPFASAKACGARVQRPLWASTSTKNKTYSDVMYVDELIGQDTVNTLPPETLEAFRDHGNTRPTVKNRWNEAHELFATFKRIGIPFEKITEQLQVDGVKAFVQAFDELIAALEAKRSALAKVAVAQR